MNKYLLIFMIFLMPMLAFANPPEVVSIKSNFSPMGFLDTELKLKRTNPDWTYVVRIKSIQVVTESWFGNKKLRIHYNVDVDGRSRTSPDADNDHMKFDKVFANNPSRDDINQLVDEYHSKVRESQTEKDWEAIEKAKRDEIKREVEERLKKEYEEKVKKHLEELEKKLKDEQEKGKIDIGQ